MRDVMSCYIHNIVSRYSVITGLAEIYTHAPWVHILDCSYNYEYIANCSSTETFRVSPRPAEEPVSL